MKRSDQNTVLQMASLKPVASFNGEKIYSHDTGEVLRCFLPHIMKKPYGKIMLGTIGVLLPSYEILLNETRSDDYGILLLPIYLSSIEGMQAPPVLDEKTPESNLPWISDIKRQMENLPNNYEAVRDCLARGPGIITYGNLSLGASGKKAKSVLQWLKNI